MKLKTKIENYLEKFGVTSEYSYKKVKWLIQDFCEDEKLALKQSENVVLDGVSNCPSELEPVLAKIEHTNSLGKSSWHEVVYFDGHWRCYAGSDTFKDGEKVVKWRYCKDCC